MLLLTTARALRHGMRRTRGLNPLWDTSNICEPVGVGSHFLSGRYAAPHEPHPALDHYGTRFTSHRATLHTFKALPSHDEFVYKRLSRRYFHVFSCIGRIQRGGHLSQSLLMMLSGMSCARKRKQHNGYGNGKPTLLRTSGNLGPRATDIRRYEQSYCRRSA